MDNLLQELCRKIITAIVIIAGTSLYKMYIGKNKEENVEKIKGNTSEIDVKLLENQENHQEGECEEEYYQDQYERNRGLWYMEDEDNY